jgi:hypothetical protein
VADVGLPVAGDGDLTAEVFALLGQLPVRFWRCLQPDHREVDWTNGVGQCATCGLTSEMTRDFQARFTPVIENRVRRDTLRQTIADLEQWAEQAAATAHAQGGGAESMRHLAAGLRWAAAKLRDERLG